MASMCRKKYPSLEQIASAIEQATLNQNALMEDLRKSDSYYERNRNANNDAIRKIQEKQQQDDVEQQRNNEEIIRSYQDKQELQFDIFSQHDEEAPRETSRQVEVVMSPDSDNNTQSSIHVALPNSEEDLQTVTERQSNTYHQGGLGVSEQPELRNKRQRPLAKADHAENDDVPQPKKARHGNPSNASAITASRIHAGSIPHNSQSSPHQTGEPSFVHRQPEEFRGITNPVVGEIYKIEDRRTKDGYLAVVLPLDDFREIGISRSIHDTDLKKVPPCYRYDAQNKKILGWHKDFEDDGPNIFNRKFPCMFFNKGISTIRLVEEYHAVGERFRWISAKVLRPFDPQAVMTQDNSGRAWACFFSDRLKLIREKRASATPQMSVVERDEEDGQIGKNAPNIPSTDKSPRASSANNMLRQSSQAFEPSSSQSQGSPCQEQTEHPGINLDGRPEPHSHTLEEINQQRLAPTPKGHGDGQSQLQPHDTQDALGRLKSIEEAASADWGNVATFMQITEGLPGIAVSPRPPNSRFDTNPNGKTQRANHDIILPAILPKRPEAVTSSAPGARNAVGNQADTNQVTPPHPGEISVGQEHTRASSPSRLQNTAVEVLNLGGRGGGA